MIRASLLLSGCTALVLSGCAATGPSGPSPIVLAAGAAPMGVDCAVMEMTAEPGEAAIGLTEAQSALMGHWVQGMWESGVCHTLSVEDIQADGTARVVFANGPSAVAPPTARRVTGTVSERGILRFTLPDGAEVSYALDGEILRGILRRDGTMSPVALTRG